MAEALRVATSLSCAAHAHAQKYRRRMAVSLLVLDEAYQPSDTVIAGR